MIEKHIFLSPDYFENFICKMGKCRKPCCEGWPVTFSVEDTESNLMNLSEIIQRDK